jgi:hypothetical protein
MIDIKDLDDHIVKYIYYRRINIMLKNYVPCVIYNLYLHNLKNINHYVHVDPLYVNIVKIFIPSNNLLNTNKCVELALNLAHFAIVLSV